MQLHFLKQFPWGEPTHFIEKIWAGFSHNDFLREQRDGCWSTEAFKENWPYGDCESLWGTFMNAKPKIHTMRDDINNRWHDGRLIHFVQWTGKPYRSKIYQFAPVIPCMSVQKVFMSVADFLEVTIDDSYLYYKDILTLAINDGFNSVEEMQGWFFPPGCRHDSWLGKIIHWTDLRY